MPQINGAHFARREDLDAMLETDMISEEDYNKAIQKYFGKEPPTRAMSPVVNTPPREQR